MSEPAHVVRARPPRGDVRAPASSRDPAEVARFLEDAAHHRGHADAVAWPETEGEWAWLLAQGVPVLATGAQSSLTRGATPSGGLVASTSRMRSLLTLDEHRARVEPGLTLAELLAALRARDLVYPPAPTWHGATIGGTVSTNAAGASTFKHGTTRRWVRGLTIVLATGGVIDMERGQHVASDESHFELVRGDGTRARIPIPRHVLPQVPKCSAGYHSAERLDLVDLFVGSEGTLGVVTEIVLDVAKRTQDTLGLLAFFDDARDGYACVAGLRDASHRTWASKDARGIDIAAIEHADGRALKLVREHGGPAHAAVARGAELALFILADLPLKSDAGSELGDLDDPAADSAALRTLRLVRASGARMDDLSVAVPGDARALDAMVALRESIPLAVNARLGELQREKGPGVHKVGGDVIVPFHRLTDLLADWERATSSRGLDALHWGHVSDGNLHPNILPRDATDVVSGEEALLEVGRAAIRLGGSPLAEHGVGRHPLKQRLMRELVGDAGVEGMRATKRALDPLGILAPGVLFEP